MAKTRQGTQLHAQPLYKRAELEMTGRIASGRWKPGAILPNEFALAEEFGVSQGTVRKALMAMEARGLLSRAPGRGTMVCRTTPEESLYAFFRLRDAEGAMVVPVLRTESIEIAGSTEAERAVLGQKCARVARLYRVRENEERPFVLERMSFDAARVDGVEADSPLPSSLYPYLHDRFGMFIVKVHEEVTADLAPEDVARALEIAPGTPVLRSKRIAHDLTDRAVELRQSWYRTDFASYQVELSRSDS